MISLIICSRTPNISNELATNIDETIGCEYELVVIDNSKNEYSIFSAYNEGVRRSSGDVLCFMHDDILYRTKNWGAEVNEVIKDENIGVVGVIGSYILTKDYGYWDRMQPYVTGRVVCGNGTVNNCNYYFDSISSNDIAMVDGMWFCLRKDIFSTISFDNTTYKGFHFYDMDICMQSINLGKKNKIVRGIEIVHKGQPQYNIEFCEGMELFYKKWNHMLPYYCGEAIGMSDKNYLVIYGNTKSYYTLLKSFNTQKKSLSFRLGEAFAFPYRKIISILKGIRELKSHKYNNF